MMITLWTDDDEEGEEEEDVSNKDTQLEVPSLEMMKRVEMDVKCILVSWSVLWTSCSRKH